MSASFPSLFLHPLLLKSQTNICKSADQGRHSKRGETFSKTVVWVKRTRDLSPYTYSVLSKRVQCRSPQRGCTRTAEGKGKYSLPRSS